MVVNSLEQFICALHGGKVSCSTSQRDWTKVPGLSSVEELALVGSRQVCGRRRSGEVRCSTVSPDGRYGGDELWTVPVTDAVAIASGAPEQLIPAGVVELDAGTAHVCVRIDADADGRSEEIECIGDPHDGRLGKLGEHVSLSPRPVAFPESFPIELPPIGGRAAASSSGGR